MKVRAICIECDSTFWRDEDQEWRERCVPCWLASKEGRPTPGDYKRAYDDLRAEFGSNLRGLLQLTHPDRHGGSELSTRVSQWLNGLRNQLNL